MFLFFTGSYNFLKPRCGQLQNECRLYIYSLYSEIFMTKMSHSRAIPKASSIVLQFQLSWIPPPLLQRCHCSPPHHYPHYRSHSMFCQSASVTRGPPCWYFLCSDPSNYPHNVTAGEAVLTISICALLHHTKRHIMFRGYQFFIEWP